MKYAEVILPLPLANTFTYCIPEAMAFIISRYCRVIVPFGKKHYYTGVVTEIHDRCPEQDFEIKEIFLLLDEKPVIRHTQLLLWQWISSYYLCSAGEVYRAAMPSGLKIESETIVSINPDYEAETPLKPNHQKILDVLTLSSGLSVSDLEKNTGIKNIFPVVNNLISTGAIEANETLKRSFKPKTETYICLADSLKTEKNLQDTLESLKRAKQQEQLLLEYIDLCGIGWDTDSQNEIKAKAVMKKLLLERSGIAGTVLNALIKRGIFKAEEKIVSRITDYQNVEINVTTVLTEQQQNAYKEIKKTFETKDITLLHGVTSSGKTEVYIRMINDALSKGQQALYLLPEFAVSTQITERLKIVFGKKLLVYNSGISDNERVEIWNRLLSSDEPLVVLGIRVSVFLPFGQLGLVVVDEEQDSSYKQQDPAPRYHTRNVAMMLANKYGAKTLLGSAAPSLESYLWAKKGKYGYVTLDSRYGGSLLPRIEVVDVKALRRKRLMVNTLFSPLLKEKINEALTRNEQVILFQNRRGFAPQITCQDCGWVPHCDNCDVSLTYHKNLHRLVCHYCNFSIPLTTKCPACDSSTLKMQGFGTEKIEEEVAALFPAAKIDRLDIDTARTRNAFRRILSDFEDGKTQILIGTQMVTKGLDFANVSVVGILSADGMMNIPDFRADERAFQMMLQVSGRAGRRDKQGFVVLQTSAPDNIMFHYLRNFDYEGASRSQLMERHHFRYPPYTRLIMIILRSSNEQTLDKVAEQYCENLRLHFGNSVFGPVYPPVTRVHTLFIRKIMLKMEVVLSVSHIREKLGIVRNEINKNSLSRQVIMHYDVDPQ